MSSSEARAYCKEIIQYEKEINTLNGQKRFLEELRKKRFESLDQYFEASGDNSITCDGRLFQRVTKEKNISRITDSKKKDVLDELLKKEGFRDTERLWKEFKTGTTSEKVEVSAVQLVKEKKVKKVKK